MSLYALCIVFGQRSEVGVPSQAEVFVVGRICCDTESADGHLNHASVLLEGASGVRVRLDLQKIKGYTLFPGQVRSW